MQRKRNHRCFKVRYRGLKCNLFLLQSFIQSRHNGSSRLTRAFHSKMSGSPIDRLKTVNLGNISWTLRWPREITRVCENVYEWNWETKPFSYTMMAVQSVITSATCLATRAVRTTNSSIVQERDSARVPHLVLRRWTKRGSDAIRGYPAAELIRDQRFKHVSLTRQSARSRFPSACGHSPHGKTASEFVLTQRRRDC